MRNIYSVGRFSRLGLLLLTVVCSLGTAWAQDALAPYAVYYDLGDMPTIRQMFATNGQESRTPGAEPKTALKVWNSNDDVPEFYLGTKISGMPGNYFVSKTSIGMGSPAIGGDYVRSAMGWNRNLQLGITTPWLNPGTYRLYVNTAWDQSGKNKTQSVQSVTLDGVAQSRLGKSYFYSYSAGNRTYGQQKEALVTNLTSARYDFAAFVGYIDVTSAGQHELRIQLVDGNESDVMIDMFQFIPVTDTDKDADYIWPKFDIAGNAHFEGYNTADVVDEIVPGKKFYQVADPSVYGTAAIAGFNGLDANKAVTIYREDKWTRIAEFTTDANGDAAAVLPAGNFFWAYDDDLSWTLNAFTMEGTDKIIVGAELPESYKGKEQQFINNFSADNSIYGYEGMPFSLSSGLGFGEVTSSDESVVKFDNGVLKFVGCGDATVTFNSKASDYYKPVQEKVSFTVKKAQLKISVGSYDKKLHEDLPEFEIVYDGFKCGDTEAVFTSPLVVTCNAEKESTSGEYPIELSGAAADNYEISFQNGMLTIGRMEQTITFNQTLAGVYGDTIELSATSTSGLPVSFYSADANIQIDGNLAVLKGAGNASITAFQTGSPEYLPAADVTLPIAVGKRTLTVTADNNLGLKGAKAPEFSYTYSGFVFDDDERAISNDPEFVTDAVADGIVTGEVTTFQYGAPLNAYSIYMVPTTGTADNYAISPVNGTFVVVAEPMKQKITIAPFNPYYKGVFELDAESYSVGSSYTQVKTNLPITFVSSRPDIIKIDGNIATVLDFADEVTITAYVESNDTYSADSASVVVSVSKIPITITANDAERIVFNPEPEFSYTVSGEFMEGDNEETIRGILAESTITTKARFRSKAGAYDIDVNGPADAEYYKFIYEPGVLTVNKATTRIEGFGGTSFSISYGDRADITAAVVSDFIPSTGAAGVVQKPYMTSADSTIADIYVIENESFIVGNGLGSTEVYAYFDGNDYYEAAPAVSATHEVIVVPREMTLVADDASRYASQANPEFTFTALGLSSTYKKDNLEELFRDSLAVAPVLATDATENSMRGNTYEIYFDNSKSTPYLPNYDIVAYKSGHLTITGGVQQSINFGAENITRINTGNNNEFKYKLSATATSGLTVTYSLANPSIECATLNGDILTFDRTKQLSNLIIIAHQDGNNYYGAAPQVSQNFGLVQFHGTVTDSSTYEPIANATVRIYREINKDRTPEEIEEDARTGRTTYPVSDIYQLVDEVKTDADGFYSSTLVQGLSRFKIEVIAGEGYMNLYDDFRSGSNGITYTWTNGITTQDAPVLSGSSYLKDYPIPPQPVLMGAASIEGKIFIDETSDFVNSSEDVMVYLLQAANPKSATPRFTTFYKSLIPTPEAASAAWKASGSYKFDNIPYGKYYLGVTYPGGVSSNLSTGYIFTVDSSALDTAYITRDFLITGRTLYTQVITASEDDIAASLSNVNVYPNPTSNGIFNIATEKGAYNLTILNAAQQTVYAAKVNAADYQVNLSGQADGIYFILLDFGDEQITQKLTIIK